MNFNSLSVFVIFFTTLLFTSACNKEGDITPPIRNGNLRVLVCDITQANYFGGAEVFLYKTNAERTTDAQRLKYYRKTTTDNSDPMNIGGIFYDLPAQSYYIFCRRDLGGGNFLTGGNDCSVKADTITTSYVKVL